MRHEDHCRSAATLDHQGLLHILGGASKVCPDCCGISVRARCTWPAD